LCRIDVSLNREPPVVCSDNAKLGIGLGTRNRAAGSKVGTSIGSGLGRGSSTLCVKFTRTGGEDIVSLTATRSYGPLSSVRSTGLNTSGLALLLAGFGNVRANRPVG